MKFQNPFILLLFITILLEIIIIIVTHPTNSWQTYQTKIPNGNKVVDDDGVLFGGVGHTRMSGGGKLNPFGRDFANAGYKWTKSLCEKDSDGDGKTNGQELGDPKCIWKPGETPQHSCTSHPGFVSKIFCSSNEL
jgi:dopamine beta-monooxygenase